MSLVLCEAEASFPKAEMEMLRERYRFQREQGADGSACGRNRPTTAGEARRPQTPRLFGSESTALLRFLAGPELRSPLSALLLSRNLLFFKVFCAKM